MAQLPPDGEWLIQQINGEVILFHRWTEEEIVRWNVSDANATAQSMQKIHDSALTDEQKCFAYFWSGYFHAGA